MKKIFVVDDDADILDAMQMLLETEGYSVDISTKGEDAEKLNGNGNLPNLILLDILLSGKDGREIAMKLKKQDSTKHIPILMMSAHPSAHLTIKEYLADDFIAKPFDVDELLVKVRAHLH